MRAPIIATLCVFLGFPACGTTLGAQAQGAGVTLGMCVAACAANCVSELFQRGSAGASAKRYGWCLAPCSAQCLPTAARAFVAMPNPPPRCVPGPAELKKPPEGKDARPDSDTDPKPQTNPRTNPETRAGPEDDAKGTGRPRHRPGRASHHSR